MHGNKTEKRNIGDFGEDLAAGYLESKGYSIVCRNFACRAGETDIIAVKDGLIAFVEVKTRKNTAYGLACEAVDYKKQRRLLICAGVFIKLNPEYGSYTQRMDIIEIYKNAGLCRINHIENAFS